MPVASLTDAERLLIVIGALVTLMLAALDQTIVAPALPTIGAQLGDADYLSWVVSAYFLTATAVTPLYGKLADLRGRRPTLYTAIALFTLGSIGCALAPSMAVLIVGRAVQGLGGGGLIALVQTIIGDVVPPIERARYMVYISMVWATASVSGPLLGGVFAEHLHWSMIFWINLPLAAIAVVMIRHSMQKLPDVTRPARLDLVGSALVVVATIALMLALTWGGVREAWGSPTILGLLALSAVLFAGFAHHIARVEEALIPLPILAHPVIAVASSALFFAAGGQVGLSVFAPLWFAQVHGLGPADAGLGLMALSVGTVIGANIAGRMMRRLRHYRRFVLAGLAVSVAATAALAVGASRLPFWAAEILLFADGAGTGTLFPIGTVVVQNAVERRDLGVATGTLSFLRSLGAVVAVAILGAVLLASGDGGFDLGNPNAGFDPVAAARSGAAFTRVFAVAAFGQTIAFVLLCFLEERPLRDRSDEVRPPGTATR
ncbi:MFS transporter [Siculibacillus lacustris]|uniref:MFS transporter n=1 Tax=Siculibacillus lacustris TaxID=1549641 RepID=A0A4Q9VGQ5_9HYPH|nr:MDR family MFS transporter [Siculibacillus lacustris]TBW33693.1 MFS transporter [Siculibacillus lacustris]